MKEHVLVIGAAKSGVAVAKLLQRHGYDVTITDMNAIRELEELQTLGIHVFEKGHPEELKRENYAFVVKNPGIKYTVPFVRYFVEHKVKILTEVEIGYRYATKFKYGAVTGTNGKTTITTMLYEMLKYNHKAIAVSYTHLDVYKRQSWHQYTPQCFHSIQLRFLRYPLHARVYGR